MAQRWDGHQSSRGWSTVYLLPKDDQRCQDIFSICVRTTSNISSLLPKQNLVHFWTYQVVINIYDWFIYFYSCQSVGRGLLNWPKVCLMIEVQYLGNTAWHGVGVKRWPIGNHTSFMLYRLARWGHLWHSVTEKSKIALASYSRPSLPKLSPCYCALHFPIVPCHGPPRKSGGHCKPPHFWNVSNTSV